MTISIIKGIIYVVCINIINDRYQTENLGNPTNNKKIIGRIIHDTKYLSIKVP